jgi:hypothetical protein
MIGASVKPSTPGAECGKVVSLSRGFSAFVSSKAENQVTVRMTRTPTPEKE